MSRLVCDPGCSAASPCSMCPCHPLDPIVGHQCDIQIPSSGQRWDGLEITQVEYRELRTTHGYNNETYGAVALVAKGASPDDTMADLKVWVGGHFGRRDEIRQAQTSLSNLRYAQADLEAKVSKAEGRYAAMLRFFERVGIPKPDDWPDELDNLPF